jgi:hypothetical protein
MECSECIQRLSHVLESFSKKQSRISRVLGGDGVDIAWDKADMRSACFFSDIIEKTWLVIDKVDRIPVLRKEDSEVSSPTCEISDPKRSIR